MDSRVRMGRTDRNPFPLGAVLSLLVPALAVGDQWGWAVERWTESGGYFGHGPVVIFGALLLVWWSGPLPSVHQGWVVGCGLGAAGAFLLGIGHSRHIGFAVLLGWWLATVALLALGTGRSGLRHLGSAILLLGFAIPWPLKLVEDITLPLKGWALTLGVAWGPDGAVREGAFVRLSDGGRLLVGDVCSGLRSLLSLVAAAHVFGTLGRLPLFRRMALMLLGAGVAVAVNGARVGFLGRVAGSYGLAAAAPGAAAHDVSGVVAFGVGLLVLLLASRIFGTAPPLSAQPEPGSGLARVRVTPLVVGSALILGGAVFGTVFGGASQPPLARGLLDLIPTALVPPPGVPGEPVGSRNIPLEVGTERLLQPDGHLSRVYGDQGAYHLLIVYGTHGRLHAPEICFRASGWEVEESGERAFPAPAMAEAPKALREIQLARGSERRLVWTWYRSAGISTPDHWEFTWRALLSPREPQVLVWVSVPVDGAGKEPARIRLTWFLQNLSPSLGAVLYEL